MNKNRKLLIIRHAKSSWEHDVHDKDRALNRRGVRDAHLVSNYLKDSVEYVDAVFSSPANRAIHTCLIFMRNLELDNNKLLVVNELYDFGGQKVLEFIKSLDDAHNTVMIFGHNHAFTAISNLLGSTSIDNLSTSGFVELHFNVNSWSEINKGKTHQIVIPKQLKS
jgi:phosphohistidine phosphatase